MMSMNQLLVQSAASLGRNFSGRPHYPIFGREPLFGFIPSFVAWNIVILLVVVLIFWWLLRSSHKNETALEVLKKRYVSGEIDRETYIQLKKDISD
ncbi:MAG TPA: SHOCT domain-containing protein [Candidatus Altiarchaeales archaeon]|nr:SHOCT domain-containing protein [Candidatus Altiarchaeales archaeon]